MKRILIAFSLLFAIVFVTGCTGDQTGEIPFDYTEAMTPPSNLRISGKLLQWDPVEGGSEYIVFADGVEKEAVSTTQYDFSSLSGTSIIFQVKAKGPKGMADSAFSVSVAYNANPAQEKSAIEGLMVEYDLEEVPEGFAEELVRKGMTASQMETVLDAFQTFVTTAEAVEDDPIAINTALKTMMTTEFNFEAIASAFLVTMAPKMMEEAIAEIQAEIDEYESWGYWYEDQINELETQITLYESLLDLLEDTPEAMLIALVETYEQLVALQADIDNDFIQMILDLFSGEFVIISEINASEIILIKDEFVTILEENLPSMEYMILMMEMAEAMVVATSDDQGAIDTFKANKTYYAAEAILSIQAITAFLDTIDLAFIEETIDIAGDVASKSIESTEMKQLVEMSQMRMLALLIEYYNKFLDENDELIDQMDAVFTDAQKEAMFDAYMAELDPEMMEEDILYSVLTNMSYEELDQFADIMDKVGEKLLDSLVATDSEILLLIAEMNGFDDFYYEEYFNRATGETYANETAMAHASSLVAIELIGEVVVHLGAVANTLTATDMEFIANVIADNYPFRMMIEEEILTDTEVEKLRDNMRSMLKKQLPKLLQLIQNLTEFVDDEEVIDAVLTEFGEIHTHFISEYGSDYHVDEDYESDTYGQYALIIHFSGWVSEFMNSTHTTIAENLVKAIADLLITPEMLEVLSGEKTEIETYEVNALEVIDFILDEMKVFKTYDKDSLSSTQRARIDSFMPGIGEIMAE